MIDARRFRDVMGLWPTGVSVVTGIAADGEPLGFVIGSFCSVSLAPPLVSFCPQKTSATWQQMRGAGRFCVNVLAQSQGAFCRRFATGPLVGRFAGVAHRRSDSGCIRLDGCSAWIDATVVEEVDAGDHWIVIGGVDALATAAATAPMVFAQGRTGRFEPTADLAESHFQEWENALDSLSNP